MDEIKKVLAELITAIECNVEGKDGNDYVRLQYIADELDEAKKLI